MRITRRHVLAVLAVGGAASALGTGAVGLSWWDRPPGEGLKVLSPQEYDLVQAVGEAWMPRGGTPELSAADAEVGLFFDELLAHSPEDAARMLKLLLQALDDKPRIGWFSAYRHLPLESRQEILAGWIDHPRPLLRRAVHGMIVLLSMGWTTHPEVARILRPSFGCGYGR